MIWAAFVLVFFSLSQSKLTPYIVPMLPALSLLTGRAIAALPPRRFAAHLAAVAAFAAIVAAVVLLSWTLPALAPLLARASSASVLGFAIAFLLLALGAAIGALAWCCRGMVVGAALAAGVRRRCCWRTRR